MNILSKITGKVIVSITNNSCEKGVLKLSKYNYHLDDNNYWKRALFQAGCKKSLAPLEMCLTDYGREYNNNNKLILGKNLAEKLLLSPGK